MREKTTAELYGGKYDGLRVILPTNTTKHSVVEHPYKWVYAWKDGRLRFSHVEDAGSGLKLSAGHFKEGENDG